MLALSVPVAAQSVDSTPRQDSIPVKFSFAASGFVLSNVNGDVDPFYHASALLHVVVNARVGDNVDIPMRLLSEAWNFSQPYSVTLTTLRPAIRVAVRSRHPGDSLAVLAGDLWRVRHGEGLSLDDFESRGAAFGAYSGHWTLDGHLIGWGWTGVDDLYTLSLGYADRIAIRFLDDSPDIPGYRGSRVVSTDARVAIPVAGTLYGELARNVDAQRWGGLVGVRGRLERGRHRLSGRVEYRHYDRNFFRNDDNVAVTYSYFSSLTALDKPMHSFHLYQTRRGRHDVFAVRVQGRASVGSWFVDADVEGIAGTVHEIAYEAAIGVSPSPVADLRVGILNKIFQFPIASQDMFALRDSPWCFMRATIDLSGGRR